MAYLVLLLDQIIHALRFIHILDHHLALVHRVLAKSQLQQFRICNLEMINCQFLSCVLPHSHDHNYPKTTDVAPKSFGTPL